MRLGLIVIMLAFVYSCEKESEKISILTADVKGESIHLEGHAARYRDIRNEEAFGIQYTIWNLESPALYIRAYDSTFTANEFIYPAVKAEYAFTDPEGRAVNYISTGGSIKIEVERKGILSGTFNFILTNNLDETDTLKIDDGKFEITLEEYDRVW